jgi:hypothetical protein
METLFILLALALPPLLGGLWLNLFVPGSTPGRVALIWGNGLLIGLLAIPLLMRLLDALGLPLSFLATASLTGILILIAGLANMFWRPDAVADPAPPSGFASLSSPHKLFFLFLALLMALRVTTLGLELLGRPLFPWDATMHWATKARVWFDSASIVPFVENDQWLELGGEGVFTDHHPGYPITTPLLQVWMNLATGRWDESLMNLPWLLCLIALAAAFYGQIRAAGTGATFAIAFTYMLLSMPLINTHVALAGYADLFLGACYCAAIMAFHNWSMHRQHWQAMLALVFALSCTLVKNEGFYWLLTFIPALVVVLLPGRKAAVLLAFLLLTVLALLILLPGDFVVAGHSLNRLGMHYRPRALVGIAKSIWVHASWHLFGYLLLCLLPVSLIMARRQASRYLGIATALASAVGLFLVLFLFTGYALGAVRFTAVGRISIQLVPGLLFLVALLFNEVLTHGSVKAPREHQSPVPS